MRYLVVELIPGKNISHGYETDIFFIPPHLQGEDDHKRGRREYNRSVGLRLYRSENLKWIHTPRG